jgi:uncharacterized membrane protein
MIKRALLAAAAVLALAATPLASQQHQHGQPQGEGTMDEGMMHMMRMMHGGEGMGGMMKSMHPQPAMLLHAAAELGLTDEQTERLTALEDAIGAEREGHAQAAMDAHRRAAALLDGESPDLDAYAAALGEAADHMVQAHVGMVRATLEARSILTPEQLEKVKAMPMMHGGMSGGRMMR